MTTKILHIDTETSGVSEVRHGILQIAAILEIDRRVVDVFETYVRPWEGAEIDDGALAVSGIARSDIPNFPSEDDAYRSFIAFLGRHISRFHKADKAFLSGYNVSFDDRFLRELARRCGDSYLGSYKWPDLLDTRVLAAARLMSRRHQMQDFKLGTVALELLGQEDYAAVVDDGGLHDALTDVRLSQEILWRCLPC